MRVMINMDCNEFLDVLNNLDTSSLNIGTDEIAGVQVSIYEDIDRVDNDTCYGGTQTYYLTAEGIDGGNYKCVGYIEMSYDSWVDTNWMSWTFDD